MSETLSLREAKRLLGLRWGLPSPNAVEEAYARKLSYWSGHLNGALSLKQRERASDAIAILQEAKKVCLADRPPAHACAATVHVSVAGSSPLPGRPSGWRRFMHVCACVFRMVRRCWRLCCVAARQLCRFVVLLFRLAAAVPTAVATAASCVAALARGLMDFLSLKWLFRS